MSTKKDFLDSSEEEYEIISNLNESQQKVFAGYTSEQQKFIMDFPLSEKVVLLNLSPEKFAAYEKNHRELKKNVKRHKLLETALDDGQIPPGELNQTYANLKELENKIDYCKKRGKEIISGQQRPSRFDSTARPGVPSIRPMPAGRDFTTLKKRKI